MKFRSLIYAMSLLLAAPFFAACNDEDTEEQVTTIETTRIKNVTYDSAVAVSYIVGSYSDCGICYSENENPTIAGKTLPAVGNVEFESSITGLTSGKTYYVRTYAIVNGKPVYGAQKSFTTVADGKPLMSIVKTSNVAEISANFTASVMATGGKKITTRGIAWVKDEGDLEEAMTKIAAAGEIPSELANRAGIYTENEGGVSEEFSVVAENLDDESTYGVVAFAVADGEVFAGEVSTFKTVAYKVPVASIVEVKDVTGFSMTVKCKIETVNPLDVTARGVLFGTSTLVANATEVAATAAGEGEFEVTLSDLSEGTTYYLWAYGENRKGRATSARTTQATLSARPVVEIGSALSNVIGHSMNATMKVTSLGVYDAPLTEVGFVYGTTSVPTITSSTCTKVVLDGDVNVNAEYEKYLGSMKAGTRYYVRAFASNEYGTSYSATLNATTAADLWDSYCKPLADGEAAPYFNNMQLLSTNPAVAQQSARAQKLWSDLAAYIPTRNTTYSLQRISFGHMLDTQDPAVPYLQIRIYFTNGTNNYTSFLCFRWTRDENGLFTFSDTAGLSASNMNFLYNTDKGKEIFDELISYFTTNKFAIDYQDASYDYSNAKTADACIRYIPVDNPDDELTLTIFRITGSKATAYPAA